MAVTFGKTTKGGGSLTGYTSVYGCKFTSDEATTLSAIGVYLEYDSNDAKTKCAIYDSSYNLVSNATTDEVTITSGQDGWIFLKFSTKPSVSALTVYWLCWCHDYAVQHYFDAGSTGQLGNLTGVSYAQLWPASITFSGGFADSAYSIYALGTPAPSVSDTVTVTDTLTDIIRGNARDISVNDSTSLSESLNIIVLSITVNDSVTVSESVTVSMPSIAVQEYVKATLVCNINVNDTVSVSESVSMLPLLVRVSVNDTISIAEAITSVSSLADISVSDAITLAEFVSSVASLFDISVYETVSILEKVYFEWWQGIVEPTPDWTDIEPVPDDPEDPAWTDFSPEEPAWTDV